MPESGAKKRRRHVLISTSSVVKRLPISRPGFTWIRVQPVELDTSYSVVVFAKRQLVCTSISCRGVPGTVRLRAFAASGVDLPARLWAVR